MIIKKKLFYLFTIIIILIVTRMIDIIQYMLTIDLSIFLFIFISYKNLCRIHTSLYLYAQFLSTSIFEKTFIFFIYEEQ